MSFLTLGVVSNGWAALLPASSLEEQCRKAVEAGYGYVELRQGALGGAELAASEGPPWPIPEALARVRQAVPELGLNLAVEAPFLARQVPPQHPYVLRCAAAANALGGSPPVLRLVDLSPVSGLPSEEALDARAAEIAALAQGLAQQGVALALENSKHPLGTLRAVLERAAAQLPAGVPAPRLCWDPHNQISQRLAPEDPVQTARDLSVPELFEFHFKQGRHSDLQPVVGDGEIDWQGILSILRQRGYRGPALFEIPAGPDIWERLERSTAYVRRLLAEVAGRSA